MKKHSHLLVLLIIVSIIAQACSAPKKMLHAGKYSEAINKSVSKLRKNKDNDKLVLILEEAYSKANESDNQRIVYLKKEGKPDNWSEVYLLYVRLAARQDKVKPILPLKIKSENRQANIPILDYTDDMIASKQKAAEYLYASSLKMLESGSKLRARQAYQQLLEVKRLYPNYKDAEEQLNRARHIGTNFILIQTKNTTGMSLPPEFERQLANLDTRYLEREWVVYHLSPAANLQYDYDIIVNLQSINISPEAYREQIFDREREIVDGWVYAQDSKGNYILDSLGNKVKTDKYVRLNCRVKQVSMRKEAQLIGSVDFYDRQTKQRLTAVPINAMGLFDHTFAVIQGDPRALDKNNDHDLIRLSEFPPMNFPSNFELIMQSSNGLNEAIAGALRSKRSLVEQ